MQLNASKSPCDRPPTDPSQVRAFRAQPDVRARPGSLVTEAAVAQHVSSHTDSINKLGYMYSQAESTAWSSPSLGALVPSRLHKPETSARTAQQLTAEINAVCSVVDLLALLNSCSGCLNHIHVACAFKKSVQLADRGNVATHSRAVQLLVSKSYTFMDSFSARELSNILWAAGKLGWIDDTAWITALLEAAGKAMHQAQPQALSLTLYACALLRHRPAPRFLQQYHAASEPLLPFFQPQALSNTLWAHAALSIQPPPQWLSTFYLVTHHQIRNFSPQGTSNTLHSLACLSLQPPPPWLHAFLAHTLCLAPVLPPQELSNTLWALANLPSPQPPPAALLVALLSRLASVAPTTQPQHMANILHSCARLRLPLPPRTPHHLLSIHPPASLQPCELASTLWALARLRCQPPPPWLSAALAATLTALPRLQPHELATTVWALSRLPHPPAPGPHWSSALLAACTPMLPSLPAKELSILLLALPHLRIAPPPTFLHLSTRALAHYLPAAHPTTLLVSLLALARLRHPPPTSWAAAHLGATLPCITSHAYTPHELAALATAAARLGLQPPDRWLLALLGSLLHQLPAASCREAANVLWALGKMRPGCCAAIPRRPRPRASDAAAPSPAAVRPAVAGSSALPSSGSGSMRGGSGRGVSGSGASSAPGLPCCLVAEAVLATAVAAVQLGDARALAARPVTLCCLLYGLAAVRCRPPARWLQGVLAALLTPPVPPAASAGLSQPQQPLHHQCLAAHPPASGPTTSCRSPRPTSCRSPRPTSCRSPRPTHASTEAANIVPITAVHTTRAPSLLHRQPPHAHPSHPHIPPPASPKTPTSTHPDRQAPALQPPSTLSVLTPRQLSTLTWSLGRLQYRPPFAFLAALQAAALPHLPASRPMDTLVTLHALNQLSCTPTPTFTAAAIEQLLRTPLSLTPRELALTSWSLARLWCRLGGAELLRLQVAVEVRSAQGSCTDQQMAGKGLHRLLQLAAGPQQGCCSSQ